MVHGLDGDPVGTWEADDGTVWPRDLLPKEMKNVRVLTYGYNGSIMDTTSVAEIGDHALNLVGRLDDERSEPHAQVRPIIFIGHSLGGIIIKQASQSRSDEIYWL